LPAVSPSRFFHAAIYLSIKCRMFVGW